jgi:hypothetical protein
MSPESRARVLRVFDQVWQAARRPSPGAQELELMREYTLRIVDSVVEDEVARRAEGREGA